MWLSSSFHPSNAHSYSMSFLEVNIWFYVFFKYFLYLRLPLRPTQHHTMVKAHTLPKHVHWGQQELWQGAWGLGNNVLDSMHKGLQNCFYCLIVLCKCRVMYCSQEPSWQGDQFLDQEPAWATYSWTLPVCPNGSPCAKQPLTLTLTKGVHCHVICRGGSKCMGCEKIKM